MVALITGARTDRRVPEVSVLVDYDTPPTTGLHDDSVGETNDGQPLPPDTLRRLCCEANIIPVVLNGGGVTLDVGREQRVANREQRRALRRCTAPVPTRAAPCGSGTADPSRRGIGRSYRPAQPAAVVRHASSPGARRWLAARPAPDRTITLRVPTARSSSPGPPSTSPPPAPQPQRPNWSNSLQATPQSQPAAAPCRGKEAPRRPTPPPLRGHVPCDLSGQDRVEVNHGCGGCGLSRRACGDRGVPCAAPSFRADTPTEAVESAPQFQVR